MERDLKKKIECLLKDFNAKETNEYFCNGDFLDDCDAYFEENAPADVLDYLTDAFYTIDVDFRDTDKFDNKVQEALLTALQMLS